MKTKRALLSVSDKTGLTDFASALHQQGFVLLSTGGTAAALRAADIPVTDVSAYTGQPEILDGRVKTLHPKIHAGILQRRASAEDRKACEAADIPPIDVVCCNLYPFQSQPDIETIDIGGVTLLRAAAKNHADVWVVVSPQDYARVLEKLPLPAEETAAERRELAGKAFRHTAAYDKAIAIWMSEETPLRYGENPHQQAVFLPDDTPPAEGNLATARLLHGKEMSHNNYLDADAALETAREFYATPAAVIVKHTNPCGVATGQTLAQALAAAWDGDCVSAYGSIIAFTRTVDLATAQFLKGRFVEAIVAPGFDADALDFLQKKSKDIRLLSLDAPMLKPLARKTERRINGGLLLQDADVNATEGWDCVTERPFPENKRALADFGIAVCKHLKSNAIAIVYEYAAGVYALLGMGAGQPNRVESLRKLACTKAAENLERLQLDAATVLAEAVLVSDAFFPFADNVEVAADFGIRLLVEPGGSKHDAECIAACNARGLAMAFTGIRHFLH